MADGISNVRSGYNGYGIGGYSAPHKGDVQDKEEHQNERQAAAAQKQLDPADVMNWMAVNNNFVNIVKTPAPLEGVVTDPTVESRVAGFMENYEYLMSIIIDEFGEDSAPDVMDLVMDKLMGMIS